MLKIVKSPDCGNSPKNQFVEKVVVAIEKADRAAFARAVTDGVEWTLPDGDVVEGKIAAVEVLADLHPAPVKIAVLHALSHGRAGAANGVVTLAGGEQIGFCHVVEFASAKGDSIAAIRTYYSEHA